MKNLALLILSLISSALNGQIQNLNVLIYSTYDTNRKEWDGRGKIFYELTFTHSVLRRFYENLNILK